jgi:6-phosphogluconate dehydrogenase
MPGGKDEVCERVRPIFEAVAAKVGGEPCVTHIGNGSAGHFVKMVHNGIEYGLMQILAETYDFMRRVLGMSYEEMSKAFADWNDAELNSFLVEITSKVLAKVDDKTGKHLVEMILDTAGQKGTGKWTTEAAMDLGIPIPTIDSSVTMRQISALKGERVLASAKFARRREITDDGTVTLDKLKNAVYAAFIVTYAQGLSLLQAASAEKGYGLNLAEIAKIWRGGCIIRSSLLGEIRRAYAENPSLSNIMLDSRFAEILNARRDDWRFVIEKFTDDSIPALCLSSSLHYFDALRSERLPANLIQAQRDFFGAHTYQRTDESGTFHTEWE